MIALKSKREIQVIQRGALILREIFDEVEKQLKAGITTQSLDDLAEAIIRKRGGEPAFKGYRGFPRTACISVNEEVVHGIPGSKVLSEGDLLSFDIGVKIEGYYADAARSWPVGHAAKNVLDMIAAARDSFMAGIKAYKPGARIGDLSCEIQHLIESRGFQVVRDYVGHGIGRALHEEPQVPNYGKRGQGPKIEAGLVLAIEPMVTEGHYAVDVLKDGWTVVTRDRKLASHYEDTVAFYDNKVFNLTGDGTETFS